MGHIQNHQYCLVQLHDGVWHCNKSPAAVTRLANVSFIRQWETWLLMNNLFFFVFFITS